MVDLTRELHILNTDSHQSVIDMLREEENDIKQKTHIISILKTIEDLKKLYEEKFFLKYNITDVKIRISNTDSTSGKIFFMLFNKGVQFKKYYTGTIENMIYKEASVTFEQLNNVSKEFINQDFLNNPDGVFIRISNKDSFEELKQLLLSNNLIASLSYALMNKDLPQKHSTTQKLKV